MPLFRVQNNLVKRYNLNVGVMVAVIRIITILPLKRGIVAVLGKFLHLRGKITDDIAIKAGGGIHGYWSAILQPYPFIADFPHIPEQLSGGVFVEIRSLGFFEFEQGYCPRTPVVTDFRKTTTSGRSSLDEVVKSHRRLSDAA